MYVSVLPQGKAPMIPMSYNRVIGVLAKGKRQDREDSVRHLPYEELHV